MSTTVQSIPRSKLRPSPFNAHRRKRFTSDSLAEMAQSIREQGIISPIVVRPVKGRKTWEIVCGERRYLGADLAGLKEVPCLIRELDDRKALLVQLTENDQRESSDPVDEAESIRQLIDEHGMSIHAVSLEMGRSETWVTRRLQLATMPEPVREAVSARKMPIDLVAKLDQIPEENGLRDQAAAELATGEFTVRSGREFLETHYLQPILRANEWKLLIARLKIEDVYGGNWTALSYEESVEVRSFGGDISLKGYELIEDAVPRAVLRNKDAGFTWGELAEAGHVGLTLICGEDGREIAAVHRESVLNALAVLYSQARCLDCHHVWTPHNDAEKSACPKCKSEKLSYEPERCPILMGSTTRERRAIAENADLVRRQEKEAREAQLQREQRLLVELDKCVRSRPRVQMDSLFAAAVLQVASGAERTILPRLENRWPGRISPEIPPDKKDDWEWRRDQALTLWPYYETPPAAESLVICLVVADWLEGGLTPANCPDMAAAIELYGCDWRSIWE